MALLRLLKNEKKDIRSFEFVVNSFPMQGTRTVRLEEAILGILAIVNHILIASNGMTSHYQI